MKSTQSWYARTRLVRNPALVAAVTVLALAACGDQELSNPEVRPQELAPRYSVTNIINNQAMVNGAQWTPRYDPGSSVGTGVIRPFLDLQEGPVEQGLNTDNDAFAYDQHRTSYTNKLPLNYVPVINVGGALGYAREFVFDANESNSSPDPQFSIDEFDLYLCNDANAPSYRLLSEVTGNSKCAMVYTIANDTLFAADSTKGSGNVFDYRILVPESKFLAAATALGTSLCPYLPTAAAETACGQYLVLWTRMGARGGNYITDATFEEYSTILRGYVAVSKTANTSLKRTYNWTIDKSVSPASHLFFPGESGESAYDVTVTKTGYTDSDWAVSGQITIANPSSQSVVIQTVSDEISGVGAVTTNCGVSLPYTLPAGQQLVCSYSASLPDGAARVNTANVVLQDAGTSQGTAAVSFASATVTEVNGTINVVDNYKSQGDTPLGSASDTKTFEYQRTFTCDDEGDNPNTARIVQTNQSDDAAVSVSCASLTVTKTAVPAFTRTWNWTIDKSVSPATWNLFEGDAGTSGYTVAVTKSGYTDGNWAVSGQITVQNTASKAASIASVADQLTGGIDAAVSGCTIDGAAAGSFPVSLPAGKSLVCQYQSALPNATSRTNTATATLASGASFTGTASVTFGDPTTVVNASINVDDTNGSSWAFNDSGSQTYSRTFTCAADEGNHDNTATIRETGQSDDARVTVNCYDLAVSKTASTSFERTWDWTIDKQIDPSYFLGGSFDAASETATIQESQSITVKYKLLLGASSQDSDFGVSGSITVQNQNPSRAATINSVSDVLAGPVSATVDCGESVSFPYSLAASGSLTCSYSASVTDKTSRLNTATAVLQNYSYAANGDATAGGTSSYTGTATASFGSTPSTEIDECVTLTDLLEGQTQYVGADTSVQYCASAAPATAYVYVQFGGEAGVDVECGENQFDNVGRIVTNDTGTVDTDTVPITIDVACEEGCTLTRGYWQTHNATFSASRNGKGPAPDPTWFAADFDGDGANEGEAESFFQSGQTWFQVFWTAGQGNVYYNLAQQYMAAKLNVLAGADDATVAAAIAQAESLFGTYTPAQVAAWRGNQGQRALFISLAGTLGSYNEGLIGPGHCTENESQK